MADGREKGVCAVDCEAGRRMGCHTFCCRLLVRLDPDEREPGDGITPPKGFVDKDPVSGLCIHFDSQTNLCRNWERRPRVCREYSCNTDPLLPVVMQYGFTSLVDLLKKSARISVPPAARRVPHLGGESPENVAPAARVTNETNRLAR